MTGAEYLDISFIFVYSRNKEVTPWDERSLKEKRLVWRAAQLQLLLPCHGSAVQMRDEKREE